MFFRLKKNITFFGQANRDEVEDFQARSALQHAKKKVVKAIISICVVPLTIGLAGTRLSNIDALGWWPF